MKGKIDKYGNLYIERGDKMKSQSCPFKEKSEHDYFENCNDECPLFGEPVFDEDRKMQVGRSGDTASLVKVGLKESATITLCHRELHFEKLTDEREANHAK